MYDTPGLGDFHFLRPLWLLVILFALALHWRLRKAFDVADQWRGSIAPHLLEHLIVGGLGERHFRPYQLLTLVFIAASLALAGPTWRREITPFTADRAPLVVALELTDSMLETDQAPSRLDRARQKIRDILERRAGARTAVIAYAGSAHAVLPLTDDIQLIEIYLESLVPELMPVEGDRPENALVLAGRMLAVEQAAGTIVFMSDGIDASHAETFAAAAQRSGDQQMFLAFGRAADEQDPDGMGVQVPADIDGLKTVASAAGGPLYRATADSADIDRLMGQVRTHLVEAVADDDRLRWYDAGYYLTWPLALLVLSWFRRGWTVQWR